MLSWLAHIAEIDSPTTVHTYWIHLRAFLNYLEGIEAITLSENPARQIKGLNVAPENPDLLPVSFPPEDLIQLFGYLQTQAQAGNQAAIRDLALLRFAYVTGCRQREIAQLTLDCLVLEQYKVVILAEVSKSKKARVAYFDEETRRNLQDWLAVRSAAPGV